MEAFDFILLIGMIVACVSSFWCGYKTGIATQLEKNLKDLIEKLGKANAEGRKGES